MQDENNIIAGDFITKPIYQTAPQTSLKAFTNESNNINTKL